MFRFGGLDHSEVLPANLACLRFNFILFYLIFQIPRSLAEVDHWSFANRLPVSQSDVVETLEKFLASFKEKVRRSILLFERTITQDLTRS